MKILEILTPKRLLGNLGEDSAAKFLRKNGYRVLERNYVDEGYEVDIIARRQDILAFVEVKSRTIGHENPREPRPASAVTPEKQRRIIRAAKAYVAHHPTDKKIRFDIVEVYYDGEGSKRRVREINHLEGAFNVNTAKGYKR